MATSRHLGFGPTGSRSIRSDVPENITIGSNTKSIGQPVPEIWPFEIIQDGGPCDVINDVIKVSVSNGHISATECPIDFVFDPMVGFSGTADRMDLLPVVPNARFGRPPSWKISNDHISGQHIFRNLWSCGRWCHLLQMVTVQGNPRSAHTSSPAGLFCIGVMPVTLELHVWFGNVILNKCKYWLFSKIIFVRCAVFHDITDKKMMSFHYPFVGFNLHNNGM